MLRRFVSVLCCAALLLCSFSAAFAADVKRDPIVYIVGFMSGTLSKNVGTDDEENVMIPEIGTIVRAIASAAPAYTALKFSGDYRAFASAVCDACALALDGIRFDDNGNSVYPVSVKNENVVTAEQPYGKFNFFYYDWRRDVTQTADELNKYIDDVLEATGSEKAALMCSSMGGCIGAAYITKYGTDKLSSIIMSSSAAMGVEFYGDVLSGKLDLDHKLIYDYLVSLDLLNNADLPESLIKMVSAFGYNDVLNDIAKALSQNEDLLHEKVIVPIFSKFPGLWCFVTDDRLDECKKAAGIAENSVLDEMIDNYHSFVRPSLLSSLAEAKENGVKLAVLCSYNFEAVPYIENRKYQSDNLIATAHSSFGATCADYGSTFSDDYEQTESDGHYHISPDKKIDASTCAFPDNTWFMRDAPHSVFDPKFIYWVAYAEADEVDVYSNENYTQFLQYENKTVTPIYYGLDDLLVSFSEDFMKCLALSLRFIKDVKTILSYIKG